MPPKIEERPVDIYFNEADLIYKASYFAAVISVLLMLFGLITFVWAIPFPHLAFLGKYNGYLNWASFLIAATIYYLLKLSPMVSYIMLFMLFGFSYGIIQLEHLQKSGGPALWIVGFGVLIIGLVIQMLSFKQKDVDKRAHQMLISPVWLIVFLLKKIGIRY